MYNEAQSNRVASGNGRQNQEGKNSLNGFNQLRAVNTFSFVNYVEPREWVFRERACTRQSKRAAFRFSAL